MSSHAGNHVFSLPCKLEFAEMVPTSAKVLFHDTSVYTPCLTGDACSFPLGWVFGLMRAVTKLCKAVEVNDGGMSPTAVFDIRKDDSACFVTVRTKASSLAVRFLTIFLKDFDCWNAVADYPKERPRRPISYSGVARLLANKSGKNVCSAALPAILKAVSADVGAAETRFWWTLVDRIEKMIFLTTLSVIRDTHELKRCAPASWEACILTALRQEETKVLRSDDEIMKWANGNNVRRASARSGRNMQAVSGRPDITERVACSIKDDVKAKATASGEPLSPRTVTEASMSESSLSGSSSRSSSRSASPPPAPLVAHQNERPSYGEPSARPLEDHIRLRSCNFPPRKRLAFTAPGSVVQWDDRIPCLSGIVFGPMIGSDHQIQRCIPLGMRVNAAARGFVSIW